MTTHQGSTNFSVKDEMENILGFVGRKFSVQLCSLVIRAWKQLRTIHKCLSMDMSPKLFVKTDNELDLTHGLSVANP